MTIYIFHLIIWTGFCTQYLLGFESNCDSNCTFDQEHLNSVSIKIFPKNCTKVCAFLLIDQNTDVSENQLFDAMKNMKFLYGSLRIKNTKLTNLKILGALETLECELNQDLTIQDNQNLSEIGMPNFSSTSCDIKIEINLALVKLNLPNLKNFYPADSNSTNLQKITISNSSPNFCVSIGEMSNFLTSEFYDVDTINGKYCNYTDQFFSGEIVCKFQNLSTFDTSCQRVIGNIFIGAGDENYVYKLKNVTWIYGQLKIHQTNLTKIDFLDNLEYVSYTEQMMYSIWVEDNENLVEISFPKLKKSRTGSSYSFNSKNLLMDSNFCEKVTNGLKIVEWQITYIENKNCEFLRNWKIRYPDPGIWYPDPGIRNPHPGYRTQESGPRNSKSGPGISNAGIRNQDYGRRNPDPTIRNPDPGVRNPDPDIRNSESGPRYPESEIRIQKYGIRIKISGIRNPDPDIRNPESGPRYPESGIRNPDSGSRYPDSFSAPLSRAPRREN